MATEEDEKQTNYWLTAVLICAPVLIVMALLITFDGGWLHNIWFNYGWSSDKGNGPEALQQTILYAGIAAILIPAVRHFLKREFDKVHHKIESEHDRIAAEHEKFHRKLDAILDFHGITVEDPDGE